MAYWLDGIESIVGEKALPAKQIESSASQGMITSEKTESETASNTYINEEYGVTIRGPQDWQMEIRDELISESTDSFKSFILATFIKDYEEAGASMIVVQLHDFFRPVDIEDFTKKTIAQIKATLLKSPESAVINGKKCIKYFLDIPADKKSNRAIWAFFETQGARVFLQLSASMNTQDWDSLLPEVEGVINSVTIE